MRIYAILALIVLVLIAACSPSATPVSNDTDSQAAAASATPVPPTIEPTDEMMEESMGEATEEAMMAEDMGESMDTATEEAMMDEDMDESADAMMDEDMDESMDESAMYSGPDWTQVALTNARTGETFTLADFAGKTVYVEPMATWCSNCRSQQRTVIDVADSLGMDDYVFISLSVETNVSDQQLAEYADSNGFDWLFAVTTPELLTALTADYGRSVNVPPSTPHFLIAPDGDVSQLYTGMHNATELTELLTTTAGSQG